MKKTINTTINLVVFTYLFSILLVYPWLRNFIKYYEISFFLSIFLSILSSIIISKFMFILNSKYNLALKILNTSFFQYYLFYSLTIENFIRKKNILFAFISSIVIIVVLTSLFYSISFPFFSFTILWYFLYYYIMIFIKIRSTLINHEILKKNENIGLKWHDFTFFYKIHNFIKKNYNFSNILPFYTVHPLLELKQKSGEILKAFLQYIFIVFLNTFLFFTGLNFK